MRRIELFLLGLALIVGGFASLIVTLTVSGSSNWLVVLSISGLFLLAHLSMRRFAPQADPFLLPIVALLNLLGLVMIHRLDFASSGRSDAPLQLLWTAVGVAFFIFVLTREPKRFASYMWVSGLFGLTLLALPALLPASISEVNGARIWIRAFGFSIQPGEFAKIALLIFFAAYLVRTRDALRSAGKRFLKITFPQLRNVTPLVGAWLLSVAVLAVERDLGTSLLFFGTFVLLIYVATERFSWVAIGVTLFCLGATTAYQLFGHVRERFDIWLNPWPYAQDQSYQLVQGIFGIATGGIFGTGLGQGRPGIVPFAKTDFIISAFAEELGLMGVMALLLLYGLLVQRILKIALSTNDNFTQLLTSGVAILFALQTFVVVGGVTRLIPITGLTTPFLSYGGSSLVVNWALIALVLRISHQSHHKSDDEENLDQTRVIRR